MAKEFVFDSFDVYPSYKGGHTCLYGKYIWEFYPGHHLQNKWGWVAQHRLIMEEKLGRRLYSHPTNQLLSECVHHVDENPLNNNPDNLELMIQKDHLAMHGRKSTAKMQKNLDLEDVKKALEGRTIKEAAAVLGVTHSTIRRRCPEALVGKMRRSPHDPDGPNLINILRPYAESQDWTVSKTAKQTGISSTLIFYVLRKHNVEWVHASRSGRPRKKKTASPNPSKRYGQLTELEQSLPHIQKGKKDSKPDS
jgi:hypothetical protein